MDLLTITSLRRAAQEQRLEARVHAQIDAISRKETREGKPFWEVVVSDAETRLTLRAWSDSPAYPLCEGLEPGAFLEVRGEFSQNGSFGLEAKRWTCRALEPAERDALLGGPASLREKQEADFLLISSSVDALTDPRLRALARLFLHDFGDRFRRAAAARGNHHARRGGLVEHVAQMLRSARALCDVYSQLNRDLMVAGVVFHDSGKLWENSLPADGFTMPFDERGELLGHIPIGIELVNKLWTKLFTSEEARAWSDLQPGNEDVRLHLLHLIAAHHGELQFGSPIPPKTPEAWALHYVDNMDAKMEMLSSAYASSRRLAPRIQERVWPLPGNLVASLPPFADADEESPRDTVPSA